MKGIDPSVTHPAKSLTESSDKLSRNRRLRQQVKLCYGTYQKIFKKEINLFPFVCCKK
jgi:hypothetical protein